MFFKSNENIDKTSVNIAFYCSFIYWSGFLLINSILDLFNKSIKINSFLLLITGLIVFFVSEFVAKCIRKTKKSKK
ncbi:hypothetical protein CHCC20331_3239 [Bacillus paralicheniformis]|nr:hypothetical protein CHCC20348_2215 [Bacillus paralicheniformis]TWK87878.1 hypothetical protein CHCC20331_3239 [Bacillus paralicheniformis]